LFDEKSEIVAKREDNGKPNGIFGISRHGIASKFKPGVGRVHPDFSGEAAAEDSLGVAN
jgi:hypothetical protein